MTGEELEARLAGGELERLGDGSRRECYALPGTGLCLKLYREEATAPNRAVAREIRRFRHDERRSACCREHRYREALRKTLPPYVFAAFPEEMEAVHLPRRGWAVVETRVSNADGSPCERFTSVYRRTADARAKERLLGEFTALVESLSAYAVRFYDHQNIVVQFLGDGSFRLRIVDFEPTSRTLVPVDSLCPAMVRAKARRRARRYLATHCGVKAKLNGLDPALRRRWDRLIAEDGARIGLSECSAFLENKPVNDIFYRGLFKGRPCVVKCSSRAPDSLRNECEMARRMFEAAPEVVAEPLAFHSTPDGRMALFVSAFVPDRAAPADPASDILRMAEALRSTGIVHRDISAGNLLAGDDGHLKLMDFQFAVDRANYRESEFMRSRPVYLYLTFGNCERLGAGRWNDILGQGLAECLRHFAPESEETARRLEQSAPEMTFAAPVAKAAMWRLWAEYAYLRLRRRIVRRRSTAWRCEKAARLLSADRSRPAV